MADAGLSPDFGLDLPVDAWMEQIREAECVLPLGHAGSYALLSEVSRGGQGVVYRARGEGNRIVALKRLLAGALADAPMRHRFEREMEAAASLSHPGIVSILGIERADGQPFLAMEWIDGIPINQWAAGEKGARRGVRAIVQLMIRVAEAVQPAHQRGVIHRDLKPSNILVDARGAPHVLDFGLAKLSAPGAAPNVPVTVSDQFLGTPAYAAPEQLGCRHDEVDVRSDVYSIGVILYEALTGRLPFDPPNARSQAGAPGERTDPPRPRECDRDLEAIVLTALAREQAQRYQSLDPMIADLRRYLNGEPVLASGWSAIDQLRKTIARHRGLLGFLLTVLVLVALGGGAATVLAFKLAKERSTVLAAQQRESRARRTAEQISGFLQGMLASADPAAAAGPDLTVRQVLDAAAIQLESELAGQPEVAGAVHATIGSTYNSLGEYDAAERHLRAALERRIEAHGPEHAEVARCMCTLAALLQNKGAYEDAEALCRDAQAMQQRLLGPDHPEIADAIILLGTILRGRGDYSGADAAMRGAVAMQRRVLEAPNAELAHGLVSYAGLLAARGDYASAEPLQREALAMRRKLHGDEHRDVAESLNNLATLMIHVDKFAEARAALEEALRIFRSVMGPSHPDVATALNNLAEVHRLEGNPRAAEPLFREALAIRRAVLHPDHPLVGLSLNNLGITLVATGEYDAAEPMLVESLGAARALLGPQHPDVAITLANLAKLHDLQGHLEQAEREYREAIAIYRASLGDGHPLVATALHRLAAVRHRRGDAGAEPLCREALAIRRAALPDDHQDVDAALELNADVALGLGKRAEAEALLAELIRLREARLPEDHPSLVRARTLLEECRRGRDGPALVAGLE